jgi:hypothetical protein
VFVFEIGFVFQPFFRCEAIVPAVEIRERSCADWAEEFRSLSLLFRVYLWHANEALVLSVKRWGFAL